MDWNYFVKSDYSITLKNSLLFSGLSLIVKNFSNQYYSIICDKIVLYKDVGYLNRLFLRNYLLLNTMVKYCWSNENCIIKMKLNTRILFSCFAINLLFLLIDKINKSISPSQYDYNIARNNIIFLIKGTCFAWIIFGKIKFIICSGIFSILLGNISKISKDFFLERRRNRLNLI